MTRSIEPEPPLYELGEAQKFNCGVSSSLKSTTINSAELGIDLRKAAILCFSFLVGTIIVIWSSRMTGFVVVGFDSILDRIIILVTNEN